MTGADRRRTGSARRRILRRLGLGLLAALAYPAVLVVMTGVLAVVVLAQARLDTAPLLGRATRDACLALALLPVPAVVLARRIGALRLRIRWLDWLERLDASLTADTGLSTALLHAGDALPEGARRLVEQAVLDGTEPRGIPDRLGCPPDLSRVLREADHRDQLRARLPDAILQAETRLRSSTDRFCTLTGRGALLAAGLILLWVALNLVQPALLAPLEEVVP